MTHTKERGYFPRRSFLASAIAVAAGSTLAGGLVVASAPSASAATGSDVEFRIDWDSEIFATNYVNALRNLRTAVRAHRFRTSEAVVDVTNENGANRYITVDVHSADGDEFIRVYIRESDSYIMGWRVGTESGAVPLMETYFTLEPGITLPGSTSENTNTRFQNLANYSALLNQGASRSGLHIGSGTLNDAVIQLHNGANISTQTAARAILRIIVTLAEGARFRQQSIHAYRQFRQGLEYEITSQDMDMQNNWSLLSERFLQWTYDGVGTAFTVGEEIFTTLQRIATFLMLAHHSGLIRHGDDKELIEGTHLTVSQDGMADYWTVQEAINDAEDYGTTDIYIERGVYHEVISVPSDKSWLTIQGITGNASDVVIYNTRCNGMINSIEGPGHLPPPQAGLVPGHPGQRAEEPADASLCRLIPQRGRLLPRLVRQFLKGQVQHRSRARGEHLLPFVVFFVPVLVQGVGSAVAGAGTQVLADTMRGLFGGSKRRVDDQQFVGERLGAQQDAGLREKGIRVRRHVGGPPRTGCRSGGR